MIINYSGLNTVSNLIKTISLIIIIFLNQVTYAQCANPVVGCSTTDLSNFGSDSNNDAATIEYDNFVSSYHATIVRTSEGTLQIWGERVGSDGVSNVLSPLTINAANFPAINSSTPLKAALGSSSSSIVQGILLTTDGLYAWSSEGGVLDSEITSSPVFQKLSISGNTNGLPAGISPGDVKMMFATYKTLVITTCSGDVWVISQTPEARGNGGIGNATTWYRVMTSETGNPFLTDVVACRGNYDGLMALKSDGTIYVWGNNVLLGDNTNIIPSQTRAIQMRLPGGVTPKMISSSGNNLLRSYYVLATDGNLYTLGENSSRQLGDWTGTDRLSWVQPKYTATGSAMNDIKWFSVQEHDATYGSVNVINSNKNLYAFGQNHFQLLGTTGNSANPVMPTGLTVSDKILAVETGGHTSMIVKNCEGNFGYAGHRVRGSMGNGTNDDVTEAVYTFATAPVQICGVETLPTIKSTAIADGPGSKYCVTHPLVLNLSPAGGTLSVVSGPATVTGNTVNFTAEGTVIIEYSISDTCGGIPTVTTKSFDTADCNADLKITKVVDNEKASVGNTATFTLTATNDGPYKATGVMVKDVLPSGYTFVSAAPSTGTWSSPNWTIGNLANGASATLSMLVTVNALGPYANTATITGSDRDTNLQNNTATATPVVETNLSVTKTASKTTANVGESVIFTITASNAGPSTATGIVVNDVLPAGYTFVSATTSIGTWSSPNWTIANLANGAFETLTITATVNPSGSYTNTATITGQQNDPTPGDNSESVTPAVNHLPVAYDDTNNILSTASTTIMKALTATDSDGTIANYTILTLPTNGVLALNGIAVALNQVLTPTEVTNLTYDPSGAFTGNDTFTFNATDNSGASSLAATITISVANNPPVAHDAVGATIPSKAEVTPIAALTATDTDGTVVNYIIVTLPAHGILALNGTLVTKGQVLTPAEAGNLTYDPDGNFSGTDSFNFTATDNNGDTDLTPATISIIVEKTKINAAPDQKSIVSGNDAVTVLNVLDNDTLDNSPIIASEINLKVTMADPTGFLTLNADGKVLLAPHTPAGTYTLTYEICEKANTNNCSAALVSVLVSAPGLTITAQSFCSNNVPYISYKVVADNFSPTQTLTINFIDSARHVVATHVNMPLKGDILWPGSIAKTGNNLADWPGWTFVNGQWIQANDGFELTKPAVTMQFVLNTTKSVTVTYPAAIDGCNARPPFGIQANNEIDVVLADGINGDLEIINVMDNDVLNGAPVTASDITVKGLDFPKGITLNPDGTIDVAPGTAGGNHTLTYQICELAELSNCSTATVTVFVEVPAVAILKTVEFNDYNSNGSADIEETLTYSFSITNTGNTALENVVVTDPLPGIAINGGPINLAIGQTDQHSFTGVYTLSQSNFIDGKVSNQATVSAVTKSGIHVLDKSDPENLKADNPTIITLRECVVEIFNAVSANGDDQNKRFYVKGLECYPDNSVQIFNRWGVLVFEREHYNNNDIAFRGISEGRVTIKDSNGLPEGTYYYSIRYKDKQSKLHQEAGYLYLTR